MEAKTFFISFGSPFGVHFGDILETSGELPGPGTTLGEVFEASWKEVEKDDQHSANFHGGRVGTPPHRLGRAG